MINNMKILDNKLKVNNNSIINNKENISNNVLINMIINKLKILNNLFMKKN
jgi:hypothetical protein